MQHIVRVGKKQCNHISECSTWLNTRHQSRVYFTQVSYSINLSKSSIDKTLIDRTQTHCNLDNLIALITASIIFIHVIIYFSLITSCCFDIIYNVMLMQIILTCTKRRRYSYTLFLQPSKLHWRSTATSRNVM